MTREQKKLMDRFYIRTGWEFMTDGEEKPTPKQFLELWDKNIKWLEDVADETDRCANKYRLKHG